MVRSGVLTFGDFTTKSGRKTPYFVNTGNYTPAGAAERAGTATGQLQATVRIDYAQRLDALRAFLA